MSCLHKIIFFSAEGFPNIGDDSKDYEDYEGANAVENDADKETRRVPTPKFISESSHILVNEGETVRVITIRGINDEEQMSDNCPTLGSAAVPGGQAGVVCDHVEEGGGHPQRDAPSDRSGDQCSVT